MNSKKDPYVGCGPLPGTVANEALVRDSLLKM